MKDLIMTDNVEKQQYVSAQTLAQEIAIIIKDFFVATVVCAGDSVALQLVGGRKFTLRVEEVK